MSAHSTTDPVTPSVTETYDFAPYQSPCGRVLHVLQAMVAPGETIQIVNRDLAIAAQCSAGSIPTILRTLERDGWIERVTSTQGSLVLLVDQSLDRAARAERRSTFDRIPARSNVDRAEVADSAPPCDLTPSDPISFRITESGDPETDPPHTPHKEFNTCMLQQHAAGEKPNISEQEALLRQIGVWPEKVRAILAARPSLREAEIRTSWQAAQSRTDIADPLRLLTHCLLTNEPIYSQEELHARQTTTRKPAANVAPHQRERSSGAERRHAHSTVDYDAFLAQIRAANPGM